MTASIEQLSFELTASALAEQERTLAGLRSRAGTVLAAASIAGSFLGGEASHGHVNAWGALALVSFISCIGCAIWVLMAHELVFAFDGQSYLARAIVAIWLKSPRPIGRQAYGLRATSISNRDKVARLAGWLTASGLLLTAEIVLWIISLTG